MKRILLDKVKEALQSIGPVSLVILVVSLIFGVRGAELIEFIAGVLFLLLGLILFNIGAEASMMRIAEKIGTYITRKRKLWLLILVGFLIGFLVVIAEPNLWVLAEQFTAIPTTTLVAASALGVGIFLALTLLRIAFQIPFSTIVLIGYGIVFALGAVAPAEFLPASFDFGWVITGPLTVPFIIALGLGVASARGDSASEKDSFGLVGLIALGPIIAVLLLGLMHDPAAPSEAGAALGLWGYLLEYAKSIGIAILPFALFFFIFQIIAFKLPKKRVIRIVIGLVYTYIGLVLFLAGANVGFLSIGSYLGETIAGMDASWLLIPIGMLFGITIAVAEPSVTVLTKQVEEVTSGTLPEDHECRALAGRLARGGFFLPPRALRHFHLVHSPARLSARFHPLVLHSENLHSDCFRLRSIGHGRDDRDFPDTFANAAAGKSRRECLNRRFRPSVHRRFDADTDCSNTGFDLPFQNEKTDRRSGRGQYHRT